MCCDTCYLWIPACPVALSPSHHPCMCSFQREAPTLPRVDECCWNSQSSSCVVDFFWTFVVFFAPLFLFSPAHHHFVISCITKIQSVAKKKKKTVGGLFSFFLLNPNLWSCGPVRIDIECTLTWDCVGCVLLRENRLHSIHSNVMFSHRFLLPCPFFLKPFVHTVAPTFGDRHHCLYLESGVCNSGFQNLFPIITLYLWTFQSCFFFFFRWRLFLVVC